MKKNDPRISLLQGGRRLWWDVREGRMVPAATLYIPFGCPDWGETGGQRNSRCTFCPLPNAVIGYRNGFYGGALVPDTDHLAFFKETLVRTLREGSVHTLMVFNAGSFLAMSPSLQEAVAAEVGRSPVKRLVVESRAELITIPNLEPVLRGIPSDRLTVRIGVETQDDRTRLSLLRKGHTRKELLRASALLRELGICSGGYVLLGPVPGMQPCTAVAEACATIRWVLGSGPGDLGMNEAYFSSANVGPGTVLEEAWRDGEFCPANLWMVLEVLRHTGGHSGRVHLLPFRDEPPLLAVPSNHVPKGISEDLAGAQGCDLEFHAMLDAYRRTMDPAALAAPPKCSCRPSWFL